MFDLFPSPSRIYSSQITVATEIQFLYYVYL